MSYLFAAFETREICVLAESALIHTKKTKNKKGRGQPGVLGDVGFFVPLLSLLSSHKGKDLLR